jgi:hypothetical protein
MDTDAMHTIALLLSILSYLGTFILGYAMRSYISSHQRQRHPD